MKICLDAGHYATYNISPCNLRYVESKQMWKLHLLLKDALESLGIEVVTTRADQEKDLALFDRGELAKGCDLFISLHSNAVGDGINEKIDYPVAYCGINKKADDIGLKLAKCVEGIMGSKQKARIEHKKGNNGDYYGVLRGASSVGVPSLILEHSFHTNTKATEWLMNDDNLKKLADAEAKTIALYFGLETVYYPKATIKPTSSKKDILWLQDKLADKLKEFAEVLPLKKDGVYDEVTRIYVLLYWHSLGWNEDGEDDGWKVGKKTIVKLT